MPVGEQARHLPELRDGYGDIEPELLLEAMARRQARVVDLETATSATPRLTAIRRQHARTAIAWAAADRQLLHQNEALLLVALR